MLPLLAQVSTTDIPDSQLAYGLKLLLFASACVAVWVSIWDKLKTRPAAHQTYASIESQVAMESRLNTRLSKLEDHHETVEAKLDAIRKQIADDYAKIQASDEARVSTIHKRLNDSDNVLRDLTEKVATALARTGGRHA